MKSQEQRLAAVLTDFARTMLTDFPIQAILDRLVERIVEILPITAAGVTLISPGSEPRYIAASDEAALRFEKLQTELNEGPCLLAYQSGDAVGVPDLGSDSRFPRFAPRAVATGLAAVFTFPLRNGDRQLGALDLYRDSPGMLSADSMTTAQTLADVAAAYILNAQARDHLKDISDRSRHAALHDALTGLPNRVLLLDRLSHAFLRSVRTGKASGLLYIDLDRFKNVNDTYGHAVGDALLVAVARRLEELLRPYDTLARLAGDEFVVLAEDLDSISQANAIGARLDAALALPFDLSGAAVSLTASIGLAYAEGGDHSPEQLLHDADVAMYATKRGEGSRQRILAPHHPERHLDDLERDLSGALERQEFHVNYQPIVAAADGRIIGLEALLRWTHPTRGTVAPSTMIPLAERSGLINEIGRWVLEQAWADARRFQRDHGADLAMSVNVSARQLMSDAFTEVVADVLRANDNDPKLLTLEITESVFVRDSDRALLVLNGLKDLGVRIALDDFGTGYSSLSYLRRFPVEIVKIDRTFIADLGLDSASEIIVGAVIKLAHDLNMTVVAEGVETVQQHQEVAALEGDCCQGYYFARPMSADNIDTLLRTRGSGANPLLPMQATPPCEGGPDDASTTHSRADSANSPAT